MRSPVTARSAPEATAVPRLLSGLTAEGGSIGIDEHLARWGAAPVQSAAAHLVDQLSASGLVPSCFPSG